jgi:hypothetical protein
VAHPLAVLRVLERQARSLQAPEALQEEGHVLARRALLPLGRVVQPLAVLRALAQQARSRQALVQQARWPPEQEALLPQAVLPQAVRRAVALQVPDLLEQTVQPHAVEREVQRPLAAVRRPPEVRLLQQAAAQPVALWRQPRRVAVPQAAPARCQSRHACGHQAARTQNRWRRVAGPVRRSRHRSRRRRDRDRPPSFPAR